MASGSQSARLSRRQVPDTRSAGEQTTLDQTILNAQAAATTLSFIQNVKYQARRRLEEERLAKWTAGNHDSTSFFQKMGASMVDGERALVLCQTGTQASPARNPQDRVNLEITRSNVEAFKATSQLTRNFFQGDSVGGNRPNPNVPGTVVMPPFLRHLQAPGPKRAEPSNPGHDEESPRVELLTAEGMSDQEQNAHWKELEMSAPPLLPGIQDSISETGDDDSVAGFGETDSRRSSKQAPKAVSHKSTRISSDCLAESEASSDSSSSERDDGKPKPPILRFRAQCNFSTEFKSEERLRMERAQREARKTLEEEKLKIQGGNDKIDDLVLGWVNHFYAFEVETENQFHGAFPLIVLFMMDNIYPKKIRWHQVDWNAGYQHALHRNHALLEKIWIELSMNKIRDFRLDPITASIENTVKATCRDKLLFLKTLKRWFDQRVRHSECYDPIFRRTEIERAVRLTGRYVRFPTWMKYDKEAIEHSRRATVQQSLKDKKMTMTAQHFDEMPEFKRLILFLGSSDQTRL
eukprot:TRINITY_DN4564_c0_g1_i1.p1 TRINITY_DN4564_c0_g1~~TRINITY_DN4564_c0_g1_i1.p1  ORF type:complete len:522 (-),score=86.21 TRINITY_DN4564_c0_g1_i1:346-1911(-)